MSAVVFTRQLKVLNVLDEVRFKDIFFRVKSKVGSSFVFSNAVFVIMYIRG
jgi:hypothetical protein